MLWAGFTELGDVRDELVRTREKLQHYEAVAEELGEIKRENDRLRQLLDMQQRVETSQYRRPSFRRTPITGSGPS